MQSTDPRLKNLCIHTITTKPWSLEVAAKKYAAAGIGGVSVWRDSAQAFGGGIDAAGRMLRDEGLDCVSYVRGGFFTSLDASARQKAVDENRRIVDEAKAIGAPLIVLVCGATPDQSLQTSRGQIRDALEELLPYADSAGVKLGIEPLHPMYADCRSAVNTMRQSNELCDAINHPKLGITLDVFHVWWDDELEAQTRIAGKKGRLFSFHICDWRNEPIDLLNDRGLMGEGVIDIPQIREWVNQSGFSGYEEVEIFSNRLWAMDQDEYLAQIGKAFIESLETKPRA